MKYMIAFLMSFVLTALAAVPAVAASGFPREKFVKVVFLAYGGSASNNGSSYSAPKPYVDGDLWAIPANVVIEKVYYIEDVAVTGTTDLDVGDDDSANGFIDGSASVTLGTPGMYGYNAKVAGSYLRVETAGASDAGDIYVVPTAKYYSASGKEIKLNVTTANTAGRGRVIIEGYYAGTGAQ